FETSFKEFLRYQGAYIKFVHHIRPGDRVESLMSSMNIGGIATKTRTRKVGSMINLLPTGMRPGPRISARITTISAAGISAGGI
ncbi:MAG: hypothetical protein AAFY59_07105, partial [Pseudomonadota bacterium]